MTNVPENHGKKWSPEDRATFTRMITAGASDIEIAAVMKRAHTAIRGSVAKHVAYLHTRKNIPAAEIAEALHRDIEFVNESIVLYAKKQEEKQLAKNREISIPTKIDQLLVLITAMDAKLDALLNK